MPQFAPFDYGNVLATGEAIKGARLRNQAAQQELDPNSIRNQMAREQLAGMRQSNLLAQQQGQRAQTQFTQQQQLENTKLLNMASAEILQNPSSAKRWEGVLKQSGVLAPEFDVSTIGMDEIQRVYDGTSAALGLTKEEAPIEPIRVRPGETLVTPTGEEIYKAAPAPSRADLAPMSSALQKELIESDEIIQSSQNVIGLLDEALSLNDKAYSGIGAKTRAVIASNLPGTSEEADATIALDNIVTGQALESLKAIFGGMPTEGERKILLELQASADKTPEQRADIINRAKQAASNRLSFNARKAEAIRTGTYLTEGIKQEFKAPYPRPKNEPLPIKASREMSIDDLVNKYAK